MTLQQLRYAVTIADMKSMNKAASELFVSQPALSNTIHDLEEELQIEIFLRTNRGIVVTTEGEEFLSYARQMVELQQMMEEKYMGAAEHKRKFSVSMQHYSFAVEAFIKLVIENVKNFRSELGILYLNSFNQKAMQKVFDANELEFKPLFDCAVYVYLASGHPLAGKESISFSDLEPYPCLSFEQGNKNSFYFAEEVLSNLEYKQTIKADDRATMLNLMTGLNGYTLCSGIICEELNGDGYTAVPFAAEETMTIGYLKRKGIPLSHLGSRYIEILKQYEKHCK